MRVIRRRCLYYQRLQTDKDCITQAENSLIAGSDARPDGIHDHMILLGDWTSTNLNRDPPERIRRWITRPTVGLSTVYDWSLFIVYIYLAWINFIDTHLEQNCVDLWI